MPSVKTKFICDRCGKKIDQFYRTVWDEFLCLDCLLLRFDWCMHQDKLKLYEAAASFTFYAKDKKDAYKRITEMFASKDFMSLRIPDVWSVRYAEHELSDEYKKYKPPKGKY